MTATSLRRPWMIVQLALIAAGLAIAILFTVVSPSLPPPSFRPATLGDQPAGAVVLGKEDGGLAVGIAAAPRHGQLLVVATVFGQDGSGAAGLRTSLAIATRDGQHMTASASPCTAGCYQAVFSTSELPKRITVAFNGRSRVGFTLPPHGPSASALRLVHAAGAEYRRIRTLVTHERLGSDLTHVAYTTYYAVAPDRLHFVVRGEEQSIIIGNRRWDKSLGEPGRAHPRLRSSRSPPTGRRWFRMRRFSGPSQCTAGRAGRSHSPIPRHPGSSRSGSTNPTIGRSSSR